MQTPEMSRLQWLSCQETWHGMCMCTHSVNPERHVLQKDVFCVTGMAVIAFAPRSVSLCNLKVLLSCTG